MNQLERLKLLLGITDESKDFALEFVIRNVEDNIKSYCHLKEVPVELENVVLSIAMELYRIGNYGSEEAGQAIKTIAVGDTTTTFETHTSKDTMEGLLKGFRSQIDPL